MKTTTSAGLAAKELKELKTTIPPVGCPSPVERERVAAGRVRALPPLLNRGEGRGEESILGRFTRHASRLRPLTTVLFLLISVLCPATSALAAIFTSNTTITETNLAYEGQDIVISGAGVTVAIDGPHAFNSLLLTNGAVLAC